MCINIYENCYLWKMDSFFNVVTVVSVSQYERKELFTKVNVYLFKILYKY